MPQLTRPQLDFLSDRKTPEIAFSGGMGSGKSLAGAMKALDLAVSNQGFPGIVWGPTMRDAKESIIAVILQLLRGEHDSGFHFPYPFRHDKTTGYITLFPDHRGGRETKILVRSGEQDVVGTNAAWALADELDTLPKEKARKAWQQLTQRIRVGKVNQLCATTTPEGYKHLYELFVSAIEKNPALGKHRRLIIASMRSNPHLTDQYIQNIFATHTPEEAEARVEGKFVNLTGSLVYRHFDRMKHDTKDTMADFPNATPYYGVDFNAGRMAGIVGVLLPDRLLVLDEFVGTKANPIHDTPHLISLIQERYPNRQSFACPDASGEARNTVGWQTNIGTLEANGFTCLHDKTNPSVSEVRVPTVNRLLYNLKMERFPQVQINVERCPELVNGLEQQPWDTNGAPLKDNVIDHALDAFGYLCVQTLGERVMTEPMQVTWNH